MAKLTVYLPDDLSERVRDAGLSTSPVCQRALEAALAGPRIVVGRGGWCRVQLPQAEAAVRFAAYGSALMVQEAVLAAPFVAGPALASLPLAGLEEWANGDAAEELRAGVKEREAMEPPDRARLDDEQRGEPSRRLGWGWAEDAVADMRLRERPTPTTPSCAKAGP